MLAAQSLFCVLHHPLVTCKRTDNSVRCAQEDTDAVNGFALTHARPLAVFVARSLLRLALGAARSRPGLRRLTGSNSV